MRKIVLIILSSIVLVGLIGCQTQEETADAKVLDEEVQKDVVVEKYDGEPLNTYDVIYTLDEVLSLTFDRVLPKKELMPLLEQLDEYQIKASFFGSFEQLRMNPEAVEEIIKRGHQIESNALYKMNLKSLDYEDLYRLIKLNNEQINEMTGEPTKYIRLNSNKEYEDVNVIAAQLNMSGVIHHSYQLRGLKTDDEEKLMMYMNRAVARGGILSMNPEDAHAIPYLMKAIDSVGFEFVSLDDLIELDKGRKTFEEITGSDAIQKNLDFSNAEPFLHRQEATQDKEVALTFDDWASEAVVLEVLDILDEYDIQSTFYLKTKIVRENPNLARLLIERGHEVANHSHSHLDSTTLTPEELQNDLYKAHKIITEAIQEQPKLYFRPPFGRIDDQSALAVTAMGFKALGMYDVSSYDWNKEYTEEDVVNRVLTNVQPGSVIVMHILNDIHTPKVLPDVIEALQNEGYEFVLTSEWIDN